MMFGSKPYLASEKEKKIISTLKDSLGIVSVEMSGSEPESE
jgi:hypothetical protein